jgi:hypothetical protein
MKVSRWKLLLPLALLGVGATVATSGALATPAQTATLARCGIGKSAHIKLSGGTECVYVHEVTGRTFKKSFVGLKLSC